MLLSLAHMMLLVSINLNSILPGMIRSSQRLNQLSLITQDVLKKYAKEIKQAKLEEFRSFLNFTAMCFRDKRRQKIDNYVTGRWVLTIKVGKDGQFKKFKARWACRGFQDAQKYALQTDSPTATRYRFRVASQHAAPMCWDLLYLDLKTLQGVTYDLDRRVIHVQLLTDIGLPPYLVGLCTCSVYGRRWWNILICLGIQPTTAGLAFNQQQRADAHMCVMKVLLRSPNKSALLTLRQQHLHIWPTMAYARKKVRKRGTLPRKFISLFWLKKDGFQLVIKTPKLGNRGTSKRRRRLKIVHGLLLLMKPGWSFWNLLNTSLVGILLKMVMLKWLIVLNHWELLIHIMTEKVPLEDFTCEEKRSLVVAWDEWHEQRTHAHKFGRRSWSSCFSLLTFRTYIPCHDTTVAAWDCWRTFGTLHGPCEWQQCQRKKTNWHVLSSCWWLVYYRNSRVSGEVQEGCQDTIQDWSWRCEWLDVHRSTCQMDHWWEDREKISHHCRTVFVFQWTYWGCHT